MIETGHIACTVKESILEKAFDLGERFVRATQAKKCDPTGRGDHRPFALQGRSSQTKAGRHRHLRRFHADPGFPRYPEYPYSGYLYGEPISIGERIGMEIRKAVREKALEKIIT